MRKTLAGLTAGALLALAPSAFADSPKTTQTQDCGLGNSITFGGSPYLWPPNHKYRTYDIVATSSNPMDMVTLTSTVGNDEVIDGEELNGSGNTADDVKPNPASDSGTGSAEVVQQVRGERSGRGDGRTYTFNEMATFGMGTMPCNAQFTVTVPHDQRPSNRPAVAKAKAARRR
jgi:hypothetical protein